MRICKDSKETMKRFEMGFLNESRNCIFQQDVPQITIAGEKVGPFKKGNQANLPNWAIENLLKHDLVNIIPEDSYESLRRLQNLSREEEKHPHQFQSFHPFLYTAITRKILRLQSDKTSMDPRRYEEVEKLQQVTPFLVETRLTKILRVAKSGAYQEKRNQMAHEERWLCEELVELLSGWRQNVME
jgi:DNA replication initiation complex subunit (GINS family)